MGLFKAYEIETRNLKKAWLSASVTSAKCIGMGKCRVDSLTLHSTRTRKTGVPVNSSVDVIL